MSKTVPTHQNSINTIWAQKYCSSIDYHHFCTSSRPKVLEDKIRQNLVGSINTDLSHILKLISL